LAELPAQDIVKEGDLSVQTAGALAADASEQPFAVMDNERTADDDDSVSNDDI
jgi:hypothetical protein